MVLDLLIKRGDNMSDLYDFLFAGLDDFITVVPEFVVAVRLMAFTMVLEVFGVVVGHISSVGR